ncbi:hypothetical protein [Herbiconiux sp. L3-i23]|uniref:hypothetical protein n=1 Tax=Herbiconiux sp. L3-i23 TaxID=2905871 RepID=UPI0020568D15|nr:hypothetical protein [Herbiconiux sp. L3-i23]BDI21712.1 hypothetical protein L3i23_04880 [Herbiconiux sp. L3-i23]
MRRVHYAGGDIVVHDDICKALLRHARALAQQNTAQVVDVPVVLDGGTRALAHLVIGVGCELLSVPILLSDPELEAEDISYVERIETATSRLQPDRPEWSDEMPDVGGPAWDIAR